MTVFTGIKELLTLKGAAQKGARNIQEADLSIIKDGAIIEDLGLVLWVGEKKNLKKILKEISNTKLRKLKSGKLVLREINLSAECVLPAFTECHTHLVFAGDRKHEFEMRNQGQTYQEIAAKGGGIQHTVSETQKAKMAMLVSEAQERAQKFLQQGVTTLEVKSGYGLTSESEIKILEVAKKIKSVKVVSTYLGAHAVPMNQNADDYIEEMVQRTLPLIKAKKLAERVDMFVDKGYYSLDQARRLFVAAAELGFRITAHADQITRTGAGSFLAAWGINSDVAVDSVDHLVQVDGADIVTLAKSKTTCVLLPASDFYLKIKYPPARELIDAGARVALATDFNPGTSPTQNLSFVGVLARLQMKMTLPEAIVSYTLGAAYALNLQKNLGSLEILKQCDFVVLDGSWRDLFYQVGHHPVSHVYQQGKLAIF